MTTIPTSRDDAGIRPEASAIDRIRYLMRLSRRNQHQFASLVDTDSTMLSKILSGKLRMSDAFINRVVVNTGVSKEWLVNGTDVPFPRGQHALILDAADQEFYTAAPDAPGAPIYDIDVTAGAQPLSMMFTEDRVIGRLSMPSVNPEDPIVRVQGDSMLPRIINGGFISIRPVRTNGPISWGQIYVVILDDYRLVKYVRRHPDPEKIILRSANPQYDDIEIERSQIRGLYLVETIMNYEILG